ncbi:MAG TPA: hypothetical protein VF427_10590 [Noviherbaspirillum sp.]
MQHATGKYEENAHKELESLARSIRGEPEIEEELEKKYKINHGDMLLAYPGSNDPLLELLMNAISPCPFTGFRDCQEKAR